MIGFRGLLRILTVILVLGVAMTGQAVAQVTTGDITGRVLDDQGNLVPGVTITATNLGTGFSRNDVSNERGEYTITLLPPGNYTLSAELSGFRKSTVKDVEVNVGTRQTLNFNLQVGNLTETIEVTAESPLIETTKSDIGGIVTPTDIQNLPLLNRTFAGLAAIMPEARPVGNFDPTKTRLGTIAMNGGDGRQLDVNVDGGDNKDNVVGSLLQNFAYEGIQEFQVLQHRWTAESGRAVGGVINVVTKSGTNDLRGSFFVNHRDNDTRTRDFFELDRDARNELAGRPEQDKADFNRQEFGGSIGGPIAKDKLFYFGAVERFRERSKTIVESQFIPHLQSIPGTRVSSEIPTPYNDTLVTAKVDHRLSDNQLFFYRFSYQGNDSPNDQISNPARTDLEGGNTSENTLYSFVANHSYTISPTKLNQFSFHFQDFNNEILGVSTNPGLRFPTSGLRTGPDTNVPQQTIESKYQFRNDFTWQRPSHGVKFGVNYIYTKLDGYFFFGARGYEIFFFDDPLTIANNTNGLYPQGFATPGAPRQIAFSTGEASHKQNFHQVALYAQDDWRVSSKLTLNLGLRWDANIGLLTDQTNNRTIQLLSQLNEPRAQAITRDADKLSRTTPSWKEFQPRIGFAYDPLGDGKTVIRGGYGVFFDQIFQNLTIFSLSQSGPEIYTTVLDLRNDRVGAGQLANFRFGVDPLPAPPAGAGFSVLLPGGFGRITDPDATDPYVQKFSIGFQKALGPRWVLSSDFVHTLGVHEPRVQVINPRIREVCDAGFPGSTPLSPRCVRGANTRYFDQAFVAANLGAGRLEQINMIGTTNRSRFDSLTTTLQGRSDKMRVSVSYVLGNSRAWGGQPVASYSGNGIATTPENQFKEGEFGPTRIDERHRLVLSGSFDVPWGFQVAPILQVASARPYSLNTGVDIDGDNLVANDRICAGVDPQAVFAVRANTAGIFALNPLGCRQLSVNTQRSGFFVDASGNIDERSGRYINLDLRVARGFNLGAGVNLKVFADFYNLLDRENIALASRLGLSPANATNFMQPQALFGPGFGPPVGRPFTAVLGARVDF